MDSSALVRNASRSTRKCVISPIPFAAYNPRRYGFQRARDIQLCLDTPGAAPSVTGDVLPAVHEIVTVLGAGQKPADEQLRTWQERYAEMDQRLHELTGSFEALRQVADPLFRFDA